MNLIKKLRREEKKAIKRKKKKLSKNVTTLNRFNEHIKQFEFLNDIFDYLENNFRREF